VKGLVPVAMLLIGRGRPIQHLRGHFRSKGSTRADIAQLPVAHAHTRPSPLQSLPLALSVMRNDTFCTTTLVRKKRGKRLRMRRTYFWLWRHFLSGPLPVTWLPVAPPHELCLYTTCTFSRLYAKWIKVKTKLPNSEQCYKGKVKTHNYINRPNQSTTGKLWKP
jgi:hypothetical protein